MRLRRNRRYLTLDEAAIFDTTRIPQPSLRTEDEFHQGITFIVKLVGYGNVPRPTTRMEIVLAMRRIRADCRLRKEKKRKTIMTISNDGIKLALIASKKIKFQSLLMNHSSNNLNNLIITNHPIHRIFYVSHDSLDLHIFSYIAREGSTFKCFVFKAAKQLLAINIVRTIGQAFELCHKTIPKNQNQNEQKDVVNNHQQQQHQQQRPNRPNRLDLNRNNDDVVHIENDVVDGDDDVDDNDNDDDDDDVPTIIERKKRSKTPPPLKSTNLNKDLTLNMEQMIHDVDLKLDRLSDKIELLEKQISSLMLTINGGVVTMTSNRSNNRNQRSPTVRFSESSERIMFVHNNPRASSVISTDTTSSDTNNTIVNDDQTLRPKHQLQSQSSSSKPFYSPDSLLSSPTTNNHHQHYNYSPNSSCLLFKDLY